MTNEQKIIQEIEELRQNMNQLVNKKNKLTDPEVVALSQRLDGLLNKYSNLINNK
ncbi:MAG: aspartyl-phosphate phosphatase Spo0E family protein [Clostridium sp.]|nr:aspartyl-phosphate phosphatase Spo0E family protein [Clostridium sp.]